MSLFFLFLSKKRNLGRILFIFIHSLINSNRKLVSGEVRNLLFSVVKRESSTVAITIFCIFLLSKSCLGLTIKVCCDVASQESDSRFQKTRKFWSSKADWRLRFSLPSIILADLLGNRRFLFTKVMVVIFDWRISIRFVRFSGRFTFTKKNRKFRW